MKNRSPHGYTIHHSPDSLMKAGQLFLRRQYPDLAVSKRRLRQLDAIQMVRQKRESDAQNLGFSSRPFALCGLPVKRPPTGCLLYERRNRRFVLQVTGHPSYGLPWSQDRLVPIFLATMAIRQKSARITFDSAAEMLDTFGIRQGGSQYRRLAASFQRIFGATIFFGPDTQRGRAVVVHCARLRFNFITEARIWYYYSRDPEQKSLPDDFRNLIVLSDEFYQEISSHPIPTDLHASEPPTFSSGGSHSHCESLTYILCNPIRRPISPIILDSSPHFGGVDPRSCKTISRGGRVWAKPSPIAIRKTSSVGVPHRSERIIETHSQDPYPNSGSRSSTSRLNGITPANFSNGRGANFPWARRPTSVFSYRRMARLGSTQD